jgi:hypothetical protein
VLLVFDVTNKTAKIMQILMTSKFFTDTADKKLAFFGI